VNLEALKDRPAVSALLQRVRLDPERELMSLFGHNENMGRVGLERYGKFGRHIQTGPLPAAATACQEWQTEGNITANRMRSSYRSLGRS